MATREELYTALRNADKAGDAEGARKLAAYIQSLPAEAAPVPAPAPVAGRSTVVDGIKGAASGAGLGFGNIVLGAQRLVGKGLTAIDGDKSSVIGGAGNWLVKDADAGKARLAAENAPYKANSPLMNLVGEVGGGIVGTLPVGAALPNALRTAATAKGVVGILPRAGLAAGAGAAYGGVAGATGSNADTLGGMLAAGAAGAGTGAIMGGLSTPVAAAVGAVAGNVAQRASKTRAADFAREKVAEALARDARGTLATSGYTNPLYQAATRFAKLGDEAVVADAGGRNTNQLLDTLATLPGRTKEQVENVLHRRTAGVGARMRGAAENALNTQGQRLPSTVDSLIVRRQQDSAPLYAQLRTIDIAPSPDLVATVAAAEKLGATKLARDMATAKEIPFTLDAAAPSKWNMADLDHVKQAVDDLLKKPSAMVDGKLTSLGGSLEVLRKKLVSQLDQATTNSQTGQSLYRRARAAYEAPSALIDAGKAGQAAVNANETRILAVLKDMSENERQAFRIGAFEALREKLGNQGGQTEIMNMWKNPSMQEKLRAIFGTDRAYRNFASSAAKEADLKQLQSVGRGSQTEARRAASEDLGMSALSDAGAAFGAAKTGNLLGVLGAGRNAWNRVAVPQQVRDQMGNMLLSRGTEGASTLHGLTDLVGMVNSRNLLLSNRVGMVGGEVSGNMLARMLQQPVPQQR